MTLWAVSAVSMVITGAGSAAAQSTVGFSPDVRQRALAEIRAAAQSDSIGQRANAAEAVVVARDVRVPALELALRDEAMPVRFAALLAIGKAQIRELGAAAAKFQSDPDLNVRGAAVFAARRTGQPAEMNILGQMAMSESVTTRSNAYLILGRLGDASAIPLLRAAGAKPLAKRTSLSRQAISQIQLAEALARLGDDDGLRVMRAAMYERDAEQRVFAVTLFGDLDDRSFSSALAAMASEDRPDLPELPVAAAVSMAKLGDPGGLPRLLEAAENSTIEWNGEAYPASQIQAQATFGLARLSDPRAKAALEKLLDHPEATVRLSAAASVLRSLAENR